ncbi:MAG: hypothetical protein H6534_00890 [Chthonomonadaceae bacterium]|nr:hypothetical protein [Chthonomonadaceae bacterium]
MSLSHLAGLHSVKRLLPALSRAEAGVHAVLLYGVAGSGKSAVADALAQAWLCTAPTSEGACGECRSCLAFGRGASADFERIEPQPPSRIIRLGAIVERKESSELPGLPIQTFFRTPPLMARHRVVVIEDCDRLNVDAANALLKTLEEPHPHAKLVLTTSAVGAVLATIRSRCLAVACELPAGEELLSAFGELAEEEALIAQGAPGALAQIRAHPDAAREMVSLVRDLDAATPGAALAMAERFRAVADALADRLKLPARLANALALEQLGTCAHGLYPQRTDWANAIAEAHRRILGNGNPGLVFDALFAELGAS